MCGIAGIFAYGAAAPPVAAEPLLRVRDQMMSRGPDGEGLWIAPDHRIGLAQRRLAIIDLSDAGLQPMFDAATGAAIVFNGEIYNHRELRAELEREGHRFRSTSDTEVLLRLYLARGPSCIERLRGMYAFAIFEPAHNRLFLARDPFGIKPLYVADDGETLRFASQVKALLAGEGIDRRPDPAGHAGFFLWGHLPEPFTLYRGIRSIPAGGSLVVTAGGSPRTGQHCSLARKIEAAEPLAPAQVADARACLAEALRDSVRHHLVADVPVGVFLSAGLDSATITALASAEHQGGLRTLTLGFTEFRGQSADEVPLANEIAGHYGTSHTTTWIAQGDFQASFSHLIAAMDQPSIDGVNTYFVCKAAHEAGLKVALSGLGGDELFAGYSDFRSVPKLVRHAALPARVPGLGLALRVATARLARRFSSPKYAGLLEYGGTYEGAYLLRRGLFMPWEIPGILDPEFASEGLGELQAIRTVRETIPKMASAQLRFSGMIAGGYMRNQLLRDADWASMAHSLEVRTPLVDVPLWDVAVGLAVSGHPMGKHDMADAARPALPAAVAARPKTGFSIPVRDWLQPELAGQPRSEGRGLRGWAGLLYRRFGFSDMMAA